MSSYYRQQLESWLKTLYISTETVIDIGGEQGHVAGRTKNWSVPNYQVMDLPNYDIERPNQAFAKPQADIIFCLEVFEYLINPLMAMTNISNLLKPDGKAYITFAFAYPHHNELDRDSLRYTETGIRRLAKETKLKVKKIWYRTDASGYLETFYRADGMHPAKQYDHHDVTGFIVEFEK